MSVPIAPTANRPTAVAAAAAASHSSTPPVMRTDLTLTFAVCPRRGLRHP
jgi:hypothetical protein